MHTRENPGELRLAPRASGSDDRTRRHGKVMPATADLTCSGRDRSAGQMSGLRLCFPHAVNGRIFHLLFRDEQHIARVRRLRDARD